jgi:hypothetical protein
VKGIRTILIVLKKQSQVFRLRMQSLPNPLKK